MFLRVRKSPKGNTRRRSANIFSGRIDATPPGPAIAFASQPHHDSPHDGTPESIRHGDQARAKALPGLPALRGPQADTTRVQEKPDMERRVPDSSALRVLVVEDDR